jgi:hypothetical protein
MLESKKRAPSHNDDHGFLRPEEIIGAHVWLGFAHVSPLF